MLHKSRKMGKEEFIEIPIADSVRGLIITYLQDGKPRKYGEILKETKKTDSVVFRELNLLIERGWVIKIGIKPHTRYVLDIDRLDVSSYLSKYNLAPRLNDDIIPVDIKLDYFSKLLMSTSFKKLISELGVKSEEDVKEIIKALPFINIKTVGGKIRNLSYSLKGKTEIDIDPNSDGLEEQTKWIAIICLIMNNLVKERCNQQEKNKIEDIKKIDPEGFQRKFDGGSVGYEILLAHEEEYKRPFKLIIEWRQKVQQSS